MWNDPGLEKSEGGFFRGKEGKSLLVLVGLLIVGWPSVYYFGTMKAPEPPKRMPVAEIAPLPPPDPNPAFQGLRDKTEMSPIDDPAKELAFKKAREIRPDDLKKEARTGVTPQELCMRPSRYRGLPIHFDGYAQIVSVDEDPGFTPSNRYYTIWMNVPPDPLIPCCVLVADVPKSLPAGRNLQVKVAFDGYFLKLRAYQAVDRPRFAPLLIGRLEFDPATAAAPKEKSIWWTIWPLGLIFGYLALRIAFGLRKNLPKRTEPRQFFIEEDPSHARAKHIEPEQLNQWLASGAPVRDETSAEDED